VAYCNTDKQLRSVCTTTFATLRWTKSSPGLRSTILVRWHTAVRAADPQVLRGLLLGERPEEVGVGARDPPRPPAIVLEEIGDARHTAAMIVGRAFRWWPGPARDV
jgi:hypothetical protein